MIKRIALAVIAATMMGVVIYGLGYHGERNFSSCPDQLPPIADVVHHARSLKRAPYDPAMGKYGDIGSKLGFIVCSDVPNIAYGLSGYSLKSMLENDYRHHPSAYEASTGNRPGNPFFHRRARNLYAYFKNKGLVASASTIPKPGDLAFYRHTPKGYISHVALVTEINGDQYKVMESAPETVFAGEIKGAAVMERGWVLVGFGRMYSQPHR